MSKPINIIFDGSPGPEGPRFIEVETDDGKSVNVGEWIDRGDGQWALRITELPEEDRPDATPEPGEGESTTTGQL